MPRFVILEHDHPVLHWDLMLEAEGVLQTWRLAETPAVGRVIEATALGAHRIAYLEFEGPVSGNRGTVTRWDVGEFNEELQSTSTVRVLQFNGTKVRGHVRLEQFDASRWRFVWC